LPPEVKAVSVAKAQLQKIVIETFLGYSDFRSRIFKRISDKFVSFLYAIIELAPEGHSLYDICYCSFFCSFGQIGYQAGSAFAVNLLFCHVNFAHVRIFLYF